MTSKVFLEKYLEVTEGITKKDARIQLAAVEKAIKALLSDGEAFKAFDLNFDTSDVPAHEGRNPSTGETIQIPARKRVSVRASSGMKAMLNGEVTEDVESAE